MPWKVDTLYSIFFILCTHSPTSSRVFLPCSDTLVLLTSTLYDTFIHELCSQWHNSSSTLLMWMSQAVGTKLQHIEHKVSVFVIQSLNYIFSHKAVKSLTDVWRRNKALMFRLPPPRCNSSSPGEGEGLLYTILKINLFLFWRQGKVDTCRYSPSLQETAFFPLRWVGDNTNAMEQAAISKNNIEAKIRAAFHTSLPAFHPPHSPLAWDLTAFLGNILNAEEPLRRL